MRLISYKMSHDTGFAPNPFFGVLTLATCKPGIRRSSTRKKKDWIAGFGSKEMDRKEVVGRERLIFLMEVTEDPLPIQDYYHEYPIKRPILPEKLDEIDMKHIRSGCGGNRRLASGAITDFRMVCGDNIYEPLCKNTNSINDFRLLCNPYHTSDKQKKIDIDGKKVLISKNFYYFGGKYGSEMGLILPDDKRPNLAKGQTGSGRITEGDPIPLIEYIQDRFKKPGIYGCPFSWPTNDESWKNDENYIQP